MDRRPIAYISTFFLGASIMRMLGFLFLGYGGASAQTAIEPIFTFSIAAAVAAVSSFLLLVCVFFHFPRIHEALRKYTAYLCVSVASVSGWRLEFIHLGMRLPGQSVANNIALFVALLFVSVVLLTALIFYKEEDECIGSSE